MILQITVFYDDVVPWTLQCYLKGHPRTGGDPDDNRQWIYLPFINWHGAFAYFTKQDWTDITRVTVRWHVCSSIAN